MRRAFAFIVAVLLLSSPVVFATGDQRARAQLALGAARNALGQIDGGMASDAARTRVQEAQALFDAEKYAEAASTADAAWKLLATTEVQPTAFTVEVKEDGATKVTSRKGLAVRVEAQGVERAVDPGTMANIVRGNPPAVTVAADVEVPVAVAAVAVPGALLPKDQAVLKLRPDDQGNVGPVKLAWKKVAEAHSYEVELLPAKDGASAIILTSATPELVVRSLAPGRYAWKVKAKTRDERLSEPSPARLFELEATRIKLEVRGTDWK